MKARGADLLVATLRAQGAELAFGVPGQHALALFDALRATSLRFVGTRTELAAAHAADGHARVSGQPTPVLVSTGPGALGTLPGLQEAASASVPLVVIASQVPREGLGDRRKHLHALRDQPAAFRDIAKCTWSVLEPGVLPELVAEAWCVAAEPPAGPVLVEVPQDVLMEQTAVPPPRTRRLPAPPRAPRPEAIERAAQLLRGAATPAVLAGGGVLRAGAEGELRALVELLAAPVATTFEGKGAVPEDHPLHVGSFLEDARLLEELERADVLLVAGSGLGELSTNYFTFTPRGQVIQLDADPRRMTAALPLVGDAAAGLGALLGRLPDLPARESGPAVARVEAARAAVRKRLSAHSTELGLLDAVRRAVPLATPIAWDMTVLGYWAWNALAAGAPRTFLSAQGAGTLGYAIPAALGAAAAAETALAVCGDGGAAYALHELSTARQHTLGLKVLVIDDGCYGVLAEYQRAAFGAVAAVDLLGPDFTSLAEAHGVPARPTDPECLLEDLQWALAEPGPALLALRAAPTLFAPTHRTG